MSTSLQRAAARAGGAPAETPTPVTREHVEQGMDAINRTVAIVKPKQPYLEWARTVPDPIDISLEELRRDCTAVLLPDVADDAEAEAVVRAI